MNEKEIANINQTTLDSLKDLEIGDEIEFGNFNGKMIKWALIDKDDELSAYFLVSKVDMGKRSFGTRADWKNSWIREWLNAYS